MKFADRLRRMIGERTDLDSMTLSFANGGAIRVVQVEPTSNTPVVVGTIPADGYVEDVRAKAFAMLRNTKMGASRGTVIIIGEDGTTKMEVRFKLLPDGRVEKI